MRNIFKSFIQITYYIFFEKKRDVLFYYPQHFNRSKDGCNPFFERLLKVCSGNSISYLLLEEPCRTDKPRNQNAMFSDVLLYLILFLRKIFHIFSPHKSFEEIEKSIAGYVNIFTLGKFNYSRYITISNSLICFFSFMNKNGRVYDVQHGIIYSTHWGYFDNEGSLNKNLRFSNIYFFLYGDGYKDIFYKASQNTVFLNGRAEVLGYPVENLRIEKTKNISECNVILFSLQFTDDGDIHILEEMKRLLVNCLRKINCLRLQYRVLLKHHPRFNNIIDLSDVYTSFPFVSETDKPLSVLAPDVRIHVTYFSTTAFDYAAYGIPTYFLRSNLITEGESVFYGEYQYPLYRYFDIKDVLNCLMDSDIYMEASAKVKDWYKYFYSDFRESVFLQALKL